MTSEYTGSGHAKRFSLTRHWSDKSELLWEKRFSLTGIGLTNLNCFEKSVLVWQALVWEIWIALRYSQREGIEWEEEWKSWVNESRKESVHKFCQGVRMLKNYYQLSVCASWLIIMTKINSINTVSLKI